MHLFVVAYRSKDLAKLATPRPALDENPLERLSFYIAGLLLYRRRRMRTELEQSIGSMSLKVTVEWIRGVLPGLSLTFRALTGRK